jgi:hypothetical protein
MTVSLFTFVDMFSRTLVTAEHLLDKGVAHAVGQGQDAESVLGWRLIDDMHPLRFQLAVVCNFTQQWPARAAGLPVLADVPEPKDIAEAKAALAAAKACLAGLTADQFAGRDEVPIAYTIGNGLEPTLPAGRWLTVFATTNLYFHLNMAYAILRAQGVAIGKPDLFAGGL